MNKITIAVCDSDEEYRKRFVSYLAERKAGELLVHAFSAPEAFLDVAENNRFDAVIIGSGFSGAKEQVRNWGIPLLLLSETACRDTAEEAGRTPERKEGRNPPGTGTKTTPDVAEVRYIFRYQPMDVIWREIWTTAKGSCGSEEGPAKGTAGIEVIGVYSPMRHEMQMPFSVVLSEQLAERGKVLYVNLIGNAGFMELFDLGGEHDLGDLVLGLRNRRADAGMASKCMYELSHLYYIPPFGNPENLHDFLLDDYIRLVKFLERQTDFDTVIFDFGDGLDQFARMLERCTSIYCPVKEGFFFDCQMNHFSAYLEKESAQVRWEQLNRIVLPYSARRIHGGGDVLFQLLWSEFGDYVRACLTGGKE